MPALQIEGIARIILTSFSASGAPKSRDSNYRISCWRPASQGLFTRLRLRIYKLTDDGRREGTEPYMFSAAMLPTSSPVRASMKPSEVTIISAIGGLNAIGHSNPSWKREPNVFFESICSRAANRLRSRSCLGSLEVSSRLNQLLFDKREARRLRAFEQSVYHGDARCC